MNLVPIIMAALTYTAQPPVAPNVYQYAVDANRVDTQPAAPEKIWACVEDPPKMPDGEMFCLPFDNNGDVDTNADPIFVQKVSAP